jgi:hypothetical protein
MSLTALLAEYLIRDVSQFVTAYAFEDSDDANYYEERWELIREPCVYAAAHGYLPLLKWAYTNGCPWGWFTCEYAAQGGHLEVLRWARANGCPGVVNTCAMSAQGGHLALLRWARANGYPG